MSAGSAKDIRNCVEDFQEAIVRNRVLYAGVGRRFTDYQPDWVASSQRFREMMWRDKKREIGTLIAHFALVVMHAIFIIASHT